MKVFNNHKHFYVLGRVLGIAMLYSLGIVGMSGAAFAQYEDYNSGNDYYGTGSSDSSSNGSGYSEGSSSDYGNYFGGSSTKTTREPVQKVVKKPYVRFIPPYDSIRELIIYQAIVEVLDRDGYEVELDTIYGRATKWLEGEFGKDMKKVISQNNVNENASEMEYKIRVKAAFPCMIKPNEFTEVRSGTVTYEMEIRVRDGRYRYAVKNLVHIADPRPGEKEGVKTYFEYLMKTKDDVRGSDQVLIAADRKITAMLTELKKACDTAPIEEDDDW